MGKSGLFSVFVVAVLSMNLATAQDELELEDGSVIQYFLSLPEFTGEAPLPLAVFMGGGSGNAPISYTVYRFYASELANLGWAVAVPISPNNRSFRGVNVDRVSEMLVKQKLDRSVLDSEAGAMRLVNAFGATHVLGGDCVLVYDGPYIDDDLYKVELKWMTSEAGR